MTVRGVNESNAYMITEAFYGLYEENEELRANFLRKIKEWKPLKVSSSYSYFLHFWEKIFSGKS